MSLPGITVNDYGESLDEVRAQLTAHVANSIDQKGNAPVIVACVEKLIRAIQENKDGDAK